MFEHGPAPAAPRGFDQSIAARQQLCPLVEDGSASGASGKPACSITTMETSKRKSSGDNLPSTGLVAQHVGRSDKEARPSQSEPRAKNQLRQSRLFDGDRRPAFVALSAVGSQEKTLKPDPSRKSLTLQEAHEIVQRLLEKSSGP